MAQHKFYTPEQDEKDYKDLPEDSRLAINKSLQRTFNRLVQKHKQR